MSVICIRIQYLGPLLSVIESCGGNTNRVSGSKYGSRGLERNSFQSNLENMRLGCDDSLSP